MKVLFLDHNRVLADVIPHFNQAKGIDEADRVVVWSDVTLLERGVIEIAKRKGIPTIVVQHGRRGTSRYYPPFSERIVADKLLVWGESDRRALVAAGQDSKKIKVVGTTVFTHLLPRKEHEGINVVFSPEHWDYDVEENLAVAKELKKLKGVKLTTKCLDGHDLSRYQNPIVTDRNSGEHLSVCAEVLSTADLVVGISESTFELLAQSLNIPVVIMEEWAPKTFSNDKRYADGYRRIISEASKRATMKTLLSTIKQQLKNQNELELERGYVSVGDGGVNLNALDLICKEING